LERNLHDAAQVSVLALTATVHRALRTARDAGEEQIVTGLLTAADQVQDTMDELRTLAGSIRPAIVDSAGLGPALHALADRTSVRVEVVVPNHGRMPPHVEHAAYAAANEVLRTAAAQGEDDLQLRVEFTRQRLTLIVDGTNQEVTDALRDRAGAVGGTATSTGTQMEVTLPCA
jgi:signal transduction histidine kinase